MHCIFPALRRPIFDMDGTIHSLHSIAGTIPYQSNPWLCIPI